MNIKSNIVFIAATLGIGGQLQAQMSASATISAAPGPGLQLIEWGADDEQVYWVDARYLEHYSRGLITAQSHPYIKTRAFLGSHGDAEVSNGFRHVMCIFGPESNWFVPGGAASAEHPAVALSPPPRGGGEAVMAYDYDLPFTAFEGKWWFHGSNTTITLEVEGNRISGVIPQHGARVNGTIRREANGALTATLQFVARGNRTGSYVFSMDPFNPYAPDRFSSVQTWDDGQVYRHEMRRDER